MLCGDTASHHKVAAETSARAFMNPMTLVYCWLSDWSCFVRPSHLVLNANECQIWYPYISTNNWPIWMCTHITICTCSTLHRQTSLVVYTCVTLIVHHARVTILHIPSFYSAWIIFRWEKLLSECHHNEIDSKWSSRHIWQPMNFVLVKTVNIPYPTAAQEEDRDPPFCLCTTNQPRAVINNSDSIALGSDAKDTDARLLSPRLNGFNSTRNFCSLSCST